MTSSTPQASEASALHHPSRRRQQARPAGQTPSHYARVILDSLGHETTALPLDDERSAANLWAQSGLQWLTGHSNGDPRPCPSPVASFAQGCWLALAALADDRIDPGFDAFRLLAERAAVSRFTRRGRTSCGGACHLLPASDGWIALNLPRESDWELLPAWLERPVYDFTLLAEGIAECRTRDLVPRARLLGLAAAPLARPRAAAGWFIATRYSKPARPRRPRPLVLDLGALWAAPLCGQLLQQLGARVIKVESTTRPDGARGGPPAFFDLLNGGKESVALDLQGETDREVLTRLLRAADIVIESSRPRALEQMGILAADIVAAVPGSTWLGISGYGRTEPMRNWIAYGDDAGVAAGLSWLVSDDGSDPVFCGDAIADPLTGLAGALLAWSAWLKGGGLLLDLSLYGVSAFLGSESLAGREEEAPSPPEPPAARVAASSAASLGADTGDVLRDLASGNL
ncbi:CoA transferase [Pseudohaliea sp.]|uniref:CoA transferase n=1 Tax=Pseudohaliea sp. TaxID=2740289 RepID=UPI0032ED4140